MVASKIIGDDVVVVIPITRFKRFFISKTGMESDRWQARDFGETGIDDAAFGYAAEDIYTYLTCSHA